MDYLEAAIVIQRWYRNVRISRKQSLRKQFDEFFTDGKPKLGLDIFRFGLLLHSLYDKDQDQLRLYKLCCAVLSSMESNHVKTWYVSVALDKENSVAWIKQVKWLLLYSTKALLHLKPGMPRDDQFIQTFLATLVLLTDYSLWELTKKGGTALTPVLHKMCETFVEYLIDNNLFHFLHELLLNGLCHPRIKLSSHTLPAAMGLRIIALLGLSNRCLSLFISHILTVPAVIWHLKLLSVDSFNNIQKLDISSCCIKLLLKEDNLFVTKNKTEILALFGNLIQLKVKEKLNTEDLNVLIALLSSMKKSGTKPVTSTTWHLVFGWSDNATSNRLLDCLSHLKLQLQLLWNPSFVEQLFSPVLALNWDTQSLDKKKSLKKLFMSTSPNISQEEINKICTSAKFYDLCLQMLPQMSSDILIGLSSCGHLPSKLWCFLSVIIQIDVKSFLHELKINSQIVTVMKVMCQVTQYLLSILDDHELYEEQRFFPIEKLELLVVLLNNVMYSCLWEQTIIVDDDPVVHSCLVTLILLLQRNQRKQFIAGENLLIKDFRCNRFMSEWKSYTPRALALLHHIPYIIPHSKRIEIFYEYVKADKAELGIKSGHGHVAASYITIHRSRVLENGYEQLHALSIANIKGVIRVKFINEQGLDEAGIDELGVFKEFLEEIIKQAFSPSLGLFKTNSEGFLYPSNTSECHENHLRIFEFLGKILGKSVYEGIVVDLPFATFFLQHLVKQSRGMFYSSLDELHSLDPELSKSLHFIKHYEGDVSDLCLTFSYEEDFLGKMITHELIPGGSGIPVTSDNKINYIHQFAHYKLTTQIKEQTAAFTRGFHSVINPQWMSIFSAQEFQKVISGVDSDIDIDELRRYTQYYGGYHDKHRVISWLWDIVKNQFTITERSAFLKFVTSCSRQPLLGFSTLDPPFSIRRVDTPSEEEAVNVAGAFRSLLGIKSAHKDRLPTSSTCFNLLKLPDYNKKSILKEKLLFAITANAGFELS